MSEEIDRSKIISSAQQPGKSGNNDILPGYKSLEDFTKSGYKVLMEAIRNSNSLPNGRDWNFYSTYDTFVNALNDNGEKIMSDLSLILRRNDLKSNMRTSNIEHQTELVVEANDVILERVANNIDEMNGIRKTVNEPVVFQTVSAYLPINGSWNRVNNATFSVKSSASLTGVDQHRNNNENTICLLTAKNILRPQKFFKDIINNSNKSPWEPRIKEKPNSLKPLAVFLEETDKGEEFSHPYETELEKFIPNSEYLQKEIAVIPKPVQDTPLIEINKPEQLDELVETLRGFKEIAIDLEHHSYRSFMGITCLMQISTKEKDYLIDTLTLRDKLYVLNEVFTKPSIVKILHGADSDIQWLQRDLSLYIVNMFDTHIAAKHLNYSSLSLASLMQRFCNFMPNKKFQLADWRIRPLPDKLKSYAREDTHFLIYIYQMMKNELIQQANGRDNLLTSVFNQSTELCKKRYFKPILTEDSHLVFYRRCNRLFDNRQLYALKHLYKWRDEVSREEDESTGYVLPNNMLLEISERLPREMQGILACCNPVPPLVRSSLLDLHRIILKALEQPFEEPILKEDTRERGTTKKVSKINVDSPLHCPHDLTKTSDFRDNLPTLLENKHGVLTAQSVEIEAVHSKCSVFNTPENSDSDVEHKALKEVRSLNFLGPYERYKLVKPFIKAREEKLAAEKAEEKEKNQPAPSKQTSEAQDESKTDEERIESIKQHFLNLLRQPPPEPVEEPDNYEPQAETSFPTVSQNMSLDGSSRKRKRDKTNSDPNSSCDDSEDDMPEPTTKQKRKTPPNKTDPPPEKIPRIEGKPLQLSKTERRRLNKEKEKKRQRKMLQDTSIEEGMSQSGRLQEDFSNQRGNNKKKRGGKRKNRGKNQGRGGQNQGGNNYNRTEYNQGQSEHNINQEGQAGNNRGRGGSWRGRGHNHGRGSRQGQSHDRQRESFSAYDYASVDFRQFQGGAGGVDKPKQIKSKFKLKGKKKNANRGQNKMQSFRGTGSSFM